MFATAVSSLRRHAARPVVSMARMTLAVSAEARITEILTEKLKPTRLIVKDTSGGCGAMYDINIESPIFKVSR